MTLTTKTTTQSQLSNEMDTEADTLMKHHHKATNKMDLVDVIQDLKYELATIITKTRAVFKQQLFHVANIQNHPLSIT